MRYLTAAPLAVALVLTVRWEWAEHGDFEEEVARAALAEGARRAGSRSPLGNRAIGEAPQWVLSACASGGLGRYEAAQRYGEDAANVFRVYGADEEFAAVFDRLGHAVVPVVAY